MNENSLVICFGGPTVNKTALYSTPFNKVPDPVFYQRRCHQSSHLLHQTTASVPVRPLLAVPDIH